jgi:glycosyltransferase involved in cell wall biosynthesis
VTGHLVNGIGECADHVVEILRDPERAKAMGEAGREVVRARFLCVREIEDTLRLISRITV